MITQSQFAEQGITVSNDLNGNAALEWLLQNTSLEIDLNDIETVKNLPFSAKVFISKFDEITSSSSVVASESIEGLSQSFNNTDRGELLWQIAEQLLSAYLKGRIRFISAKPRWR